MALMFLECRVTVTTIIQWALADASPSSCTIQFNPAALQLWSYASEARNPGSAILPRSISSAPSIPNSNVTALTYLLNTQTLNNTHLPKLLILTLAHKLQLI